MTVKKLIVLVTFIYVPALWVQVNAQGRDSLSYFDPHISNFDPHDVVQFFRPAPETGYINNPHKGTTSFQRLAGEDLYPGLESDDSKAPMSFGKAPAKIKDVKNYPPTSVAYIRWVWKDLEPEQGKIRFDVIQNALTAAQEHGQTLQLRFQPFSHEDMPDWYWKTGARVDEKFRKWRGYKTPDNNDPKYLKYWGEFIRAMGARFDGHPALESLDLAYGGDWGEMGGNATYEIARSLIDIYYEAFPTTQLIIMVGSPGAEYASKQTKRNVGWRVDCFGDFSKEGWRKRDTTQNNWSHMYVAYPTLYELDGLKDKWKTAPVILETCGTVSSWYQEGYDIDLILETALRLHASVFMPKSVRVPEVWMTKIMEFNKKLGYNFFVHNMTVPKTAAPGKELRIRTIIDNRGVAPIYHQYTFAFRLTQGTKQYTFRSSQDIRTWMPLYTQFTDILTTPADFQKGSATLSCAIVDETDHPRVRMAIKAMGSDGWHPLGQLEIK